MSKIALVLLPGLDGTGLLFADFVAALGPEFDPIVVRYPPDIPLGYAELEALVRQSLPDDKPFILLGESFSGPLSISIAASRPAGLAGLILCCTFARYPRAWCRRLKGLAPFVPVSGLLVSAVRHIFAPEPVLPSVRAKLDAARSMVSNAVMRKRVGELLRIDVTGRLAQIEVPILDLRVAKDGIVPNRGCDAIRRVGPQVRTTDMSGPHFLLQAKPSEAAAVVSAFVRDIMNKRSRQQEMN